MTESPLLGYKPSIGGQEPYWYGRDGIGNQTNNRKYIRVVCGVALPILDRTSGACVILAENYRVTPPASFIAVAAACGAWPEVENALAQFRRTTKFDHVIVDKEEARQVIWRMRGINYGINEVPLISFAAPSYAQTEIGRAHVDEMISETRLNVPDYVQRELELEPEMGVLALKCAALWMRDNPAYYAPLRQPPRGNRILGMEGL